MFFSFKKKGCAIAQIGTFHYLYRVLSTEHAIAMACVNHRDDELNPSRWRVSFIAMKW